LKKTTQKNLSKAIIRLPAAHEGGQQKFITWNIDQPKAQALIAPAAVKTGKSFGASLWLVAEALANPGSFCVWIAPTLAKARIGFRYIKRFLPPVISTPLKTTFEIQIANGSNIMFLHGSDAETVIEGESIDRFVIDETGKIDKQVWYSLFTTITQTKGKGIITGTPRGYTWYYDLFKKAQENDPFFTWAKMRTIDSPYIDPEVVLTAKRLLPSYLYSQYYEANFVSSGSVFGDLEQAWERDIVVTRQKVWIRPDEKSREGLIVHGVDIAKKRDFTVFYSVSATTGLLVGYCRFNLLPYPEQVKILAQYIMNYFSKAENYICYDGTGIGEAFGDMLADADIDATIEPIIFTNQSKNEMVTKMMIAIQSGWHKLPMIPAAVQEYSSYEMTTTKTGRFSFSAPDGENDDIVSAAMLAINQAYYAERESAAYDHLKAHIMGTPSDDEILKAYSDQSSAVSSFFDSDDEDEIFDQDLE
jgi:hypothetical protein